MCTLQDDGMHIISSSMTGGCIRATPGRPRGRVVLSVLLTASAISCRPSAEREVAPAHREAVSVEPGVLDIGVVSPGTKRSAKMVIVNRGTRSLLLMNIESSCPCVKAAGLPVTIPAAGSREIEIIFDSSGEPDFRGGLAVELLGRDAAAGPVFRTKVKVDVM